MGQRFSMPHCILLLIYLRDEDLLEDLEEDPLLDPELLELDLEELTPEEDLEELPDDPPDEYEDDLELVKFWFSISKDVQEQRFESRRVDPLKQWKLSPIDLANLAHYRSRGLQALQDTLRQSGGAPGEYLSDLLQGLAALAAALPAIKMVFRQPPATLLRE